MKKQKLITLLLTITALFFCGGCRQEAAGKLNQNEVYSESQENTTTELVENMETTTVAEAETEDLSEISSESSMPGDFSYMYAAMYTNEEEGRYFSYRYNENTNKWDVVLTFGAVNIIHELDNKVMYLEYEGKKVQLPWAIVYNHTGGNTSHYFIDVTGDGIEEFILMPYIREATPVFVFDLANWRDLSPYYCIDTDLYKGVFLHEEYAIPLTEAISEVLERDEYNTVALEEDNSLELGSKSWYMRNEDGEIFENNAFEYRFGEERNWACYLVISFDGGECNIIIDDINTAYSKYKEAINVVTEYSLAAEVVQSFDYGRRKFNFRFEKDNVLITFQADSNNRNPYIELTYNGELCPIEWRVNMGYADKVYFELYDYNGDGEDDLVYTHIYEGEETVKVYDFNPSN